MEKKKNPYYILAVLRFLFVFIDWTLKCGKLKVLRLSFQIVLKKKVKECLVQKQFLTLQIKFVFIEYFVHK